MANNAQESAKATAEIIEHEYHDEGRSIYDIMAEMGLGDVRFENSINPRKQPLPLEYCSGRSMVTFGGPTTWVQSNGEVVSYWGSEEGHWGLSMDVKEDLETYFADMFDSYVEQVVKENSIKRQ